MGKGERDLLAEPLSNLDGFRGAAVGQKERELLTAHSADQVVGAQ